ncbi:TPA: hypothetical protein DDX46_02190 [Candidatus Saccharibacteria bacterium]|nr:MAG: hypothetical protein UW38_C0001G0256 [Candidatus Saccharibacteria bacterium GW2011_GWC2_44_17]HBH77535.1 hypothetical protein [Candidatus Saccharibacteria bacterium]
MSLSILFLVLAGLLWFNRQLVVDWISYRQYTPTSEFAAFAERTTMTREGKFYLYASHPSLEKTQNFNKLCDRKESSSAVLGCYAANKIYVYDIDDTKLDGIREVTTAHEMLHAAYQRLGSDEKTKVNALLDAEYRKRADDTALAERMDFYKRTQPGEHDNELHSIIGTEYDGISNELEKYYERYFDNRAALVQLHAKYAAEFTKLKDEATSLSRQLKDKSGAIETGSAQYNESVKNLNGDIESFNSRATAGQFTSRSEFNSERAALLSRINALEQQRSEIDEQIKLYESLRQRYNATVDESQQLYNSIDSRLAPAPTI